MRKQGGLRRSQGKDNPEQNTLYKNNFNKKCGKYTTITTLNIVLSLFFKTLKKKLRLNTH